MVHVILFSMKKYFYISTFRSMFAVPHVPVFCSSLLSRLPVMLLRYFLNDVEMWFQSPLLYLVSLLLLHFHMR
jgi:hypothetical protein